MGKIPRKEKSKDRVGSKLRENGLGTRYSIITVPCRQWLNVVSLLLLRFHSLVLVRPRRSLLLLEMNSSHPAKSTSGLIGLIKAKDTTRQIHVVIGEDS